MVRKGSYAIAKLGQVKEYAHGGMSSGQVCGNWWVNEGIPMLVERIKAQDAKSK